MCGLVPYNEFAGDAKPAATAFARTGYTFYKLVLIIIGYFGWLYFCNVGDVNGTKSCFLR
jgi:hypothetical protein